MAEQIQLTKNRLQTLVVDGTPGVPAIGYQFRMGYVADNASQFPTLTSSIIMSQKQGSYSYGMQFDNYNTTSNTAAVNYLTSMGNKGILNLFTISTIVNGKNAVAITNTDYAKHDNISSGFIAVRDLATENLNVSNIVADSITTRLINVQYVSSIQMSTTNIAADTVSTTTLTYTNGYGVGTLTQNTAIVQDLTSVANSMSNIYGSTMTFTNTATLNDLNVNTVQVVNYLNAPLLNAVTVSSGITTYNLASGASLSTQNVSTSFLSYLLANGDTLNLSNVINVPNANIVSASTGTVTYDLAIGRSLSTQNLSTNTFGFVTADGTSLNLVNQNVTGTATIGVVNVTSLNITGDTQFNTATGTTLTTDTFNVNIVANISTALISTLSGSFATFEGGLSSMYVSTNSLVAGSVKTGSFAVSTLNAYNLNLTSSINFTSGGAVSALADYNGVRFQDSTGSSEIGIFISTGIDIVNAKLAAVTNNGSNAFALLEYVSSVNGNQTIAYLTNIASLNDKVEYSGATLVGQGLSTNLLSTGKIFADAAMVNAFSTMYFSTGFANIGAINNTNVTTGLLTAYNGISTNNISSGKSYSGTAVIANGTVTNLSTTYGTIVDLAATTGKITNLSGSTANLDSISSIYNSTGQVSFGTGVIENGAVANLSTNYFSTGYAYMDNVTINDFSASNITTTSDMRLKKNVLPLSNALQTVLSLEPVSYDWTTRGNMREGYPEIGFIAQAVEAVLPNIVSVRDDDIQTRALGYDRLTAVLAGAVKELAARVTALEARLP